MGGGFGVLAVASVPAWADEGWLAAVTGSDPEWRTDEVGAGGLLALVRAWDFTAERKAKAAEVLEFRRVLLRAELARPIPAERVRELASWARRYLLGRSWSWRFPKFTPAALSRYADGLEDFARSRWESHDTEYFSACGWDDFQGEKRHWAGVHAREVRVVVRWLRAHGAGEGV